MKVFFQTYWWFFLIPIPIIVGVVVFLENARIKSEEKSSLFDVGNAASGKSDGRGGLVYGEADGREGIVHPGKVIKGKTR